MLNSVLTALINYEYYSPFEWVLVHHITHISVLSDHPDNLLEPFAQLGEETLGLKNRVLQDSEKPFLKYNMLKYNVHLTQ